MRFIKAGDIYHLDLCIDISIHRDVNFSEDDLKLMIEGVIRHFFDDPYFCDIKDN